jgi:hypothetical protein
MRFEDPYFGDPGTENRSLGQAENETSNSMGLSVKAFPNPFTTAGQAVAFPCQEVRLPAGDHRFGLDGLNFPAGLYTVQVRTEKTSSALRIVKMY